MEGPWISSFTGRTYLLSILPGRDIYPALFYRTAFQSQIDRSDGIAANRFLACKSPQKKG